MYFYLLLVSLSLVVFHFVTRYGRHGRISSSIPTATPLLPLIGNILVVWRSDYISSFKLFRELFEKYRPIVKFWSVTYITTLIWDPDDVKILLSDKENLNKAHVYSHLKFVAGNGLIFSDGKLGMYRRKLLNPAFHNDVLKKYLEVTNLHTKDFIEHLSSQDDDKVQNLSALASKLILTIMMETSTGLDHRLYEKKADWFEKLAKDIFETVAYRACKPYIPDWIFNNIPLGRQQKLLANEAHDFANTLIDVRRKYHENTGYKFLNMDNDDKSTGRKKFATLDLLLAHERNGLIDKQGVFDEIINLTVASHDTSTVALVFTLLMLAENEKIQETARNEAVEVINECQGTLTMDDVKKLEYIDRCVKEAIRLYPPVHMFGRSLTKDLKLKNHVVPAGADLIVTPFDMHRDPKYWTQPLKFDPDRFLPENVKNQHPFAYVPFSAGPRVCIGQKLAQLTLKALVAHILYNYRLEPVTRSKDVKFELSVVLKPSEPVFVRFIKLNQANRSESVK